MTVDDIRDIRGPIAIPAWWHWPLAMAVSMVLATAVVLGVRWWRRRHRKVSPLELAQRALARAETEALAGRSHAWAELVASTVRAALAVRVGPGVLPQTTAELSTGDWARPPMSLDVDAPRVIELLGTCDVARFARASLDAKALLASTAVARDVTQRLLDPPDRPTKQAPVIAETVTA